MPRLAWTRRGFLAAGAASPFLNSSLLAQSLARGAKLPPEKKDYRDRTTEFTFARVVAPGISAWLPAPTNRMFARRGKFLLHAAERGAVTTSVQAWTMDLKSGEFRQQTAADKLDFASLSLTPDERGFCYVDGSALFLTPINNGSAGVTKLADLPKHVPGAGVSISYDGQLAVLVSGNRLLRVGLQRGSVTVLHAGEGLRAPTLHPRRNEIAYFLGPTLMTMRADGTGTASSKPTAVPIPPGRVLDARWSPAGDKDSSALIYLHQPDDAGRTVNLREYDFVARRDRHLGLTSQFASFSPNADASVLTGASFSKAQPHVLMFVRSVARELTLCEHNATDAARVTPVFTPDSREIFFQSDREGKPAIYSITVDKLVEATEDEAVPGQGK